MGGEQRAGAGSKPRIRRVVSKLDSDHGTATTADRTLGLPPAGTICRSILSLGLSYTWTSYLYVYITFKGFVLSISFMSYYVFDYVIL